MWDMRGIWTVDYTFDWHRLHTSPSMCTIYTSVFILGNIFFMEHLCWFYAWVDFVDFDVFVCDRFEIENVGLVDTKSPRRVKTGCGWGRKDSTVMSLFLVFIIYQLVRYSSYPYIVLSFRWFNSRFWPFISFSSYGENHNVIVYVLWNFLLKANLNAIHLRAVPLDLKSLYKVILTNWKHPIVYILLTLLHCRHSLLDLFKSKSLLLTEMSWITPCISTLIHNLENRYDRLFKG